MTRSRGPFAQGTPSQRTLESLISFLSHLRRVKRRGAQRVTVELMLREEWALLVI